MEQRDTSGEIPAAGGVGSRRPYVAAGLLVLLTACFGAPWRGLLRLAADDSLFSHLPLIPIIGAYLVYSSRRRIATAFHSSYRATALLAVAGAACLLAQGWFVGRLGEPALNDLLALPMLAYVLFVYAIVAACLGWTTWRTYCFPLLFLLFLVPMPGQVVNAVSVLLQHASASVFYGLLRLSGTPVYRDGVSFQLSNLLLEVAIECSGIRSTLVLLITSLIAGYLFLPETWKRVLLVVLAIGIGILRNGFRIFSIALLTIYVDDGIIRGPLHRRGGPLFFVLSLGVLFAVLLLLRAFPRRKDAVNGKKISP